MKVNGTCRHYVAAPDEHRDICTLEHGVCGRGGDWWNCTWWHKMYNDWGGKENK